VRGVALLMAKAPVATALISVIVPTLGEAAALPRALDDLDALDGRWEVIVADGGSTDGTSDLARTHRSRPRVLDAARGRARQMNAGAGVARGQALIFLHAHTRLPPDAYARITAALAEGVQGGNFALRFEDDGGLYGRYLTWVYALQRRTGYYYGDSAIWLRTDAFAALGGYRDLPIMEDRDLVQRLERRGATACLPGPAVTSARRWRAWASAAPWQCGSRSGCSTRSACREAVAQRGVCPAGLN